MYGSIWVHIWNSIDHIFVRKGELSYWISCSKPLIIPRPFFVPSKNDSGVSEEI